jgi:hypothetical protein
MGAEIELLLLLLVMTIFSGLRRSTNRADVADAADKVADYLTGMLKFA